MNIKKIPILLIAYKRPVETKKVLDKIKKYYPDKLYVFCDFSNQNRSLVKKVKNLIVKKKYASKLFTNFQKKNLGCGMGPVTAINWIMSKEKYAIILEDDCVPLEGFFEFMSFWLKKKENDRDCFMISGNNYFFLNKKFNTFKTRFAFTHGWGTWRRSWKNFDYNISFWKKNKKKFICFIPFYAIRWYWVKLYNKIEIDNFKTYWDYQWQLQIWKNKGYSIQPPINLVKNIGFNKKASHTINENDWRINIKKKKLPKNFKEHDLKFNILVEIYNSLIEINSLSFFNRILYKIKNYGIKKFIFK